MKVGTKSILWGAHAFWWHPYVVLKGWLFLYKSWPSLAELLAICIHDLGYWGSSEIDGPEGKEHPERVARWFAELAGRLHLPPSFVTEVLDNILTHSRRYCAEHDLKPGKLCWADKVALMMEPEGMYLTRVWLSGEIKEFRLGCPQVPTSAPNKVWFRYVSSMEYLEQGKFSPERSIWFKEGK